MLYTLASKRVEQGIKQGKFASQLGISPQYLRLIEKGQVEPRVSLAFRIADLLGIDIREIFIK